MPTTAKIDKNATNKAVPGDIDDRSLKDVRILHSTYRAENPAIEPTMLNMKSCPQ